MHVATLCNGSTTDSGSVCQGSNPCVAAILRPTLCVGLSFLFSAAFFVILQYKKQYIIHIILKVYFSGRTRKKARPLAAPSDLIYLCSSTD